MRAYVYLHAASIDNDSLNEKIVELGYAARSCIVGDTFVVYVVEMDIDDLVILKLCIPSLEIDIKE